MMVGDDAIAVSYVQGDERTVAAIDPGAPGLVARARSGFIGVEDSRVAGHVLIGRDLASRELVLVDLGSDAPPRRATIQGPSGANRFVVRAATAIGSALVALIEWSYPAGASEVHALAIDPVSGAVLGLGVLCTRCQAHDASATQDGTTAYLAWSGLSPGDPAGIAAIDGLGRIVWTESTPLLPGCGERLAVAAIGIVVGAQGRIAILSRERGTIVAARDLDADEIVDDVLVAGDVAYVRIASTRAEATRTRIEAIGLPSLETRWTIEAAAAGPWNGEPIGGCHLAADDRAIYACLPDGEARAIDPHRGEVLWHWGVRSCSGFAIASAGGATSLFVAPYDGRSIVRFDPAPGGVPERATIRGRLTFEDAALQGATVHVGDRQTTSGPDGRYEAVVETRGLVSVQALASGPARICTDEVVELRGAGSYDVDVACVRDRDEE